MFFRPDQHKCRDCEWWEGWGGARKISWGTRFHGNHHVVMATKKLCFHGQIQAVIEIACDVTIHDVASPMTSYVTSPWHWCHGNHLLWFLDTMVQVHSSASGHLEHAIDGLKGYISVSLCRWESIGNPIGSALVLVITDFLGYCSVIPKICNRRLCGHPQAATHLIL